MSRLEKIMRRGQDIMVSMEGQWGVAFLVIGDVYAEAPVGGVAFGFVGVAPAWNGQF